MADKLTHQKFDQLITELIEMTGRTMAENRVGIRDAAWADAGAAAREKKVRRPSPCCDSPSLEIFSTERPTGYTGIYKCLVCDCTFDPTFRETTQ